MRKEVFARWKVNEAETDRILKLLPELATATRGEEGNVLYEIFQSELDPNEFLLHECYADANAMELHKVSEHYQRIVVSGIIPYLEVREVTIVKQLI